MVERGETPGLPASSPQPWAQARHRRGRVQRTLHRRDSDGSVAWEVLRTPWEAELALRSHGPPLSECPSLSPNPPGERPMQEHAVRPGYSSTTLGSPCCLALRLKPFPMERDPGRPCCQAALGFALAAPLHGFLSQVSAWPPHLLQGPLPQGGPPWLLWVTSQAQLHLTFLPDTSPPAKVFPGLLIPVI